MQIPEHIISSIEAFKLGDQTKAQAIEAAGDDVSETQFDEYITLYEQSLEAIELHNIKEELKDIHQELSTEERASKPSTRIWFAAATVIVMATFTFLITQSGSNNKTFDDLYQPYANVLSMRGEKEVGLNEAMRLYSLGQYQEALNAFGQASPDSLFNEYYFYRGVAALAIDNFSLAKESFLVIGTARSNQFWEQTKWYLALAHWQLEDAKNAVDLLKTVKSNEFKFEESQQLLKQLSD